LKTNIISTLGGRGKIVITIKRKMAKLSSYNSQLAPGSFLHLYEFTEELMSFACTEYTECKAFSPVVRSELAPRPPCTRKRVLFPPLVPEGGHTRLLESGRGVGGPIRTKGQYNPSSFVCPSPKKL
jgi:hypothetical protein